MPHGIRSLCAGFGFTALLFAVMFSAVVYAAQDADLKLSNISGPFDQPRRHFRLRNPLNLPAKEAAAIYAIARGALARGYGRSGHPVARVYQGWTRANTAPYLSRRHGNHYLNNYVNDIGRAAYLRYGPAGRLPVGTVIAKDSFTVTKFHEIVLGPLVIMEKMPAGYSPASGDWKFTMIDADGGLFGESDGKGAERVRFCLGCHYAAEAQDYLYFVPEAYRLKTRP